MNKLAEQLSNDIAIRAAQKLAGLNGGMEKKANMLGGLGGAALGGLGGAALGGLINMIPNDQDIPMYYHGHIGDEDIYKPYPAFEGQEPAPKINPILAMSLAGALSGGAIGSSLLNKMASYNNMEKDAMSLPQGTADVLLGARNQGIKGALKGALTGGVLGLGNSFLRDYGTEDFNPLKDAFVGSLIGTGVGGSMEGLLGAGEAALMNKIIKDGVVSV